MHKNQNSSKKPSSRFANITMMACCAVMLLPVGGYFLAGGTLSGLGSNLTAFAPLLLCVGAHVFMHKVMGKKCHEPEVQNEKIEQAPVIPSEIQRAPSSIPQVARR